MITHKRKTAASKPENTQEDLEDFENDMIKMIKRIEFRNTKNDFQIKPMTDIKMINEDNVLLIAADKSKKYVIMHRDDHNKYVTENVTKTTKHCPKKKVKNIYHKSKS